MSEATAPLVPNTRNIDLDDGYPDELAYHLPGTTEYRRLILALFAAGVATFAALYSTQVLLGTLSRRFAISESHAAWSMSITTLLLGIGMLLAGPLSDRWGRTRTIKVSLCTTALLGGACALAPSWPVLLAARALQGVALAGTPAVALVYLREEVHAKVHSRATGLYIGGTAIGGMSGRLVAGAVADVAGWRWALGAIAMLSAVCAIFVSVTLRDPRHRSRLAFRAKRGDRLTVDPATSWRPWKRDAASIGRDRLLLGIFLVAGTSMGAFVAIFNVIGLRLTADPYRLSIFGASLIFCVYPLGSVSSMIGGRVADRLGQPMVVACGGAIAACGIAITFATPLPAVVVGVAVMTIGFFIVHGVASGWATAVGQRRHHAASHASSFYLVAYYFGSSIFGIVGTSLWSSYGWHSVASMTIVLMLVPVGVGLAGFAESRRAIGSIS